MVPCTNVAFSPFFLVEEYSYQRKSPHGYECEQDEGDQKAHLEAIPLAAEKVPDMPQVSAGEGWKTIALNMQIS